MKKIGKILKELEELEIEPDGYNLLSPYTRPKPKLEKIWKTPKLKDKKY